MEYILLYLSRVYLSHAGARAMRAQPREVSGGRCKTIGACSPDRDDLSLRAHGRRHPVGSPHRQSPSSRRALDTAGHARSAIAILPAANVRRIHGAMRSRFGHPGTIRRVRRQGSKRRGAAGGPQHQRGPSALPPADVAVRARPASRSPDQLTRGARRFQRRRGRTARRGDARKWRRFAGVALRAALRRAAGVRAPAAHANRRLAANRRPHLDLCARSEVAPGSSHLVDKRRRVPRRRRRIATLVGADCEGEGRRTSIRHPGGRMGRS